MTTERRPRAQRSLAPAALALAALSVAAGCSMGAPARAVRAGHGYYGGLGNYRNIEARATGSTGLSLDEATARSRTTSDDRGDLEYSRAERPREIGVRGPPMDPAAPPPPPPPMGARQINAQGGQGGTPPATTTPAPGGHPVQVPPSQTSAAQQTRLLVYTAQLDVVVNDVEQTIGQAITLAQGAGGYLASRADDVVVIRVPAARFAEVVERLERLGDVTHRQVQAEDVSEQFHDLEIQLGNLRAVRQRLQEFLQRANTIADALAVERELERVASQIDRIEGMMRFLSDRISLSTITMRVIRRPTTGSMQPTTYGTPELVLPFDWLNELGLPRLLETR